MNKKTMIAMLALTALLLAGCASTSNNIKPAADEIKLIGRDVPGYGHCTFAFVYASDFGQQGGGPALALVGCK